MSTSKPVARKQHRCIWCGEPILSGTKYLFQRIRWEGSVHTQHWHFECEQAQQQEGRETGEWEFSPYDNERPPQLVGNAGGPEHG